MTPTAERRPCSQCGSKTDPVFRTATDEGSPLPDPKIRGWFCASCGNFTPPTGREFGLTQETKR